MNIEINCCGNCPMYTDDHWAPNGSMYCKHPENLNIDVPKDIKGDHLDEYKHIDHNCPLKKEPITISIINQ